MRVTGFEPVGRGFESGVAAQTAKGWPEGVRNLAKPSDDSISLAAKLKNCCIFTLAPFISRLL
jgi:hypothetical protein